MKPWNFTWDSSYPRMSEILEWFHVNHLEDPTKYDLCYGPMARLAVYQMALRGNHQELGGLLSHLREYGTDVECAALNAVSEAWKGVGKFAGLYHAQYSQINSTSTALRTIAYNNLSSHLDNSFSRTSDFEDQLTVQTLLSIVPCCSKSWYVKQGLGEEELCARIKFGAWLSVAAFHSTSDTDFVAFEKNSFRLWSNWVIWGSASSSVSVDIFRCHYMWLIRIVL
jgi:hypothetical protein